MYIFENSVTGNVESKKVWALYSDVSCWNKWDNDIESVSLEGAFVADSSGIMKMNNGQSLPFVLTEVHEPNSFVSVSHLGEIKICFGHTIKTNDDGNCTIIHTVEIEGGDKKQMETMGKAITAHIPESMAQLLSLSN